MHDMANLEPLTFINNCRFYLICMIIYAKEFLWFIIWNIIFFKKIIKIPFLFKCLIIIAVEVETWIKMEIFLLIFYLWIMLKQMRSLFICKRKMQFFAIEMFQLIFPFIIFLSIPKYQKDFCIPMFIVILKFSNILMLSYISFTVRIPGSWLYFFSWKMWVCWYLHSHWKLQISVAHVLD